MKDSGTSRSRTVRLTAPDDVNLCRRQDTGAGYLELHSSRSATTATTAACIPRSLVWAVDGDGIVVRYLGFAASAIAD